MEIYQLKYFIAAVSAGSFKLAAENSQVAQSSLSKAIKRLEEEIGGALFVRTNRSVTLTPLGKHIYPEATRILNDCNRLKRQVTEVKGLRNKSITVGVIPTIAPFFLSTVVSRFVELYPALDLNIREGLTTTLLKCASNCETDIALLGQTVSNHGLESEVLFTEELFLAVPSKHPLALKPNILAADLANEKFICLEAGHCLGDQIMGFCERNGLELQAALKSSQLATVQALVMAGLGIALVPRMAKISGQTVLVYRSLEKPKPMRTIVAAWRKGREHSEAAREFLKHLRQAANAYRTNTQS
jgi:LysR family hydrogen peroxide-inducible transcriptional activator